MKNVFQLQILISIKKKNKPGKCLFEAEEAEKQLKPEYQSQAEMRNQTLGP